MTTVALSSATSGTTIQSSLFNTNMTTLQTCLNGNIDDNNLSANAISANRIKQGGAATNQALVWSGTAWAPATMYGRPLAFTRYAPNAVQTKTTNSTSFADIDATNLIFSFVAPTSGNVLVIASGNISNSSAVVTYMNCRDGVGSIAGTDTYVNATTSTNIVSIAEMYATGLTGGTTYNWRLGWKVGSASTSTWSIGDGTTTTAKPHAIIRVYAIG